MNSNNCKDHIISQGYNESNQILQCPVDILKSDEIRVIYMRYTGPYKNNATSYKELIQKLLLWAHGRDLLNHEDFRLFSLYHDNPEITEENRQRTSICLAVSDDVEAEGEVGKMTIPAGKYAVGHFEIGGDQFEAAWKFLYGHWLPSSGFQADDRPCFEMYLNNPDDHPGKKSLVDIYIPVRPL